MRRLLYPIQQASGAGAAPTGLLSSSARCTHLDTSGGVAGVVRVGRRSLVKPPGLVSPLPDGAIGCALALGSAWLVVLTGKHSNGHLVSLAQRRWCGGSAAGRTGVCASLAPVPPPIAQQGRAGRAADGRTPADRGKNNLRPPAYTVRNTIPGAAPATRFLNLPNGVIVRARRRMFLCVWRAKCAL